MQFLNKSLKGSWYIVLALITATNVLPIAAALWAAADPELIKMGDLEFRFIGIEVVTMISCCLVGIMTHACATEMRSKFLRPSGL
jgi:hypothetical protein